MLSPSHNVISELMKIENVELKSISDMRSCVLIAGAIEDYTRRRNIVLHTGKDIVKVLKALIIYGDNRDSRQIVYNGLTGEQVTIKELYSSATPFNIISPCWRSFAQLIVAHLPIWP